MGFYLNKTTNNSNSNLIAAGDSAEMNPQEIPKEQLLNKVFRMEKTLQKYRTKYSELMSRFQGSLKEQEKLKIELHQSNDKSTRRINDINDTIELEKQAKMHLEEELNATIEEKVQHIAVLQTQVKVLKSNGLKESQLEADKLLLQQKLDGSSAQVENMQQKLKESM